MSARASTFALVCALMLLGAPARAAADLSAILERLGDVASAPYRVTGAGFVTDDGHPKHPGDFQRVDILARLVIDPELGEAAIEIESGDADEKVFDRYFVRRGRIFQVEMPDGEAAANDSDAGAAKEVPATPLGDISAAAVAALHPAIVALAMRERRDNVRATADPNEILFAWNDALWTVSLDAANGRVAKIARRFFHDVHGDGVEEVRYEGFETSDADTAAGAGAAGEVIVVERGRETARIAFEAPLRDADARAATAAFPAQSRDDAREIGSRDIALREIAPRIFAIDIQPINTRVVIAVFADHVTVLEGAYNSRNCDLIARAVRERFTKPVRYFAFSHLHGQYIGGVRSWIAEGATVLVPPTTVSLLEEVAAGGHELRPDALARARVAAASPASPMSRDAKPLRFETIATSRRFEDAKNALEIYNVESQHTDEYFIFYFPREKMLLTGDLLFYRPGKTLAGRSKFLCETIAKLGLDVESFVCTWPLDGYGTKNVVTGDEMRAACAETAAPTK